MISKNNLKLLAMIPVLILYLFKRLKQNSAISRRKEDIRKIASKVKAFLFLFVVACLLAFTKDNSKILVYHVIKNDAVIGTIEINKRIVDDSVIYSSESHIKATFLLTFNVIAKEKSIYNDGILVYSSIFRTLNNKTKANNEIVLENGQYKFQSSGNSQVLNFNSIKQNLITLYFEEPNGTGTVFCDNLKSMVCIIPLGDHSYKVQLSNGAYNIFHYKNGKCVKIDAVSKLFNVTLIPA